MKKIIFIILVTFICLFAFNFNAKALNSDATATCVYDFPGADSFGLTGYASPDMYFTGVTMTYSGGKVEGRCHDSDFKPPFGLPTAYAAWHNCVVDVAYNSFEDPVTKEIKCPVILLYGKYTPLTLTYNFKVLDNVYANTKLSESQKKNATFTKALNPGPTSVLNKGNVAMTEQDRLNYMTCLCGEITLKRGSIYFNNKNDNWNSKHEKSYADGFNINSFTECPSSIYYQVISSKSVKIGITDFNEGKTTPVACADTVALSAHYSSSKNPIDYVPLADVILPFCQETSKIWKMVGYLVNAIKILVPVIIIVLGSMDLGKAVVAQSEDDIKKSTKLLFTRIAAGIIIFFIPTVVNVIFKMLSGYVSSVSTSSACVECVTKPWSC